MLEDLCIPDETPEDLLLVECSQVLRRPKQTERIAHLLGHSLNWNYVLAVAGKNAVLPLVGKNLLSYHTLGLPAEVKGFLTEHLNAHLQRNMFLTGKLLEIIRSFDAEGIAILPFKGPVLATQAYGDLSARKYVDLDILVQPKQLEPAIRLLQDGGFRPISDIRWLKKSNWHLRDKKDIYFRSATGMVNVELHWKLSGSHFDLPFEMNGLWARLEKISLANVDVRTLPFDDLLIYLCLHGSRHGWERFGWICDVNELIQSQESIRWEPVIRKARNLGCENVLNLGLYLVHDFFGHEFAFRSWQTVKNDLMFMTCAKRIRSQLFTEHHKVMKIGDRYAYHLTLKEYRRDRWKLHFHYIWWYLKIIFTPRATDSVVFNLPRALEPLYYVMRPLRLFYNYALKSNKRRAL
jgi:hypothetical protein